MIEFANPNMLSAGLLALPALYIGLRGDGVFRTVVGTTKALTILLVALALATPSITVQEERNQQPSVTVLQDNSMSTELMDKPELDLEGVQKTEKIIATGNSSDLSTGILQNIEEDSSYLLISDLQSSKSLDDLAKKVRERNSTIHVLKTDMAAESAVSIRGPETTYPGVDNSFTVKVSSSSGKVPEPSVSLNGEPVNLEKKGPGTWSFRRSFDKNGYNSIKASINTQDRWSSNNVYYKTVKVTEKPKVLVVGDEGRIGQEFSQFYSFEYRNSVPDNLEKYYAVIAKKKVPASELSNYIAEGNGLVYTGDYEEPNHLLPVQQISKSQQSQGAKIVIALDISYSAGEITKGFSESQQIAYSLIETMPYQTQVGVIAYRQQPNLVNRIVPLGENRNKLKSKISRLETDGRSRHDRGIRGATELLNGTGNVVLITDGTGVEEGTIGKGENQAIYNKDERENTLEIASEMEENLIVIGTGKKTNEEFLKDLAEAAEGQYLTPKDAGRLNFKFAAGGTESKAERLYVVNKDHFITDNIETEGTAAAFDPVEAKRGGQTLVTSDQGKPFLTTWRYGVGRVAAFSGGEKDLGAVMYRDSSLVSRTLSWAVGQPQRKEDRWIKIEDGQVGEEVKVRASYPIKGLNRQGENLYSNTIDIESTGIHSFNGSLYSYNYNNEIGNVGYDNIEEFASSTGGEVFKPGQKQQIAEEVKNFSNQKVSKQKGLADYFLAAALLVFLSEIGYRKRRGKK